MLKLADPALMVPLPRLAVPSKNWTVPVGVPPLDVTFAVKVTLLLEKMEEAEETREITGVTRLMVYEAFPTALSVYPVTAAIASSVSLWLIVIAPL